MEIKQTFGTAITDYQYLLNRNYPQRSILKIVGDKYQLSGQERSILYRGICTSEQIKQRKSKLFKPASLKNKTIYIDAYNVLIIIGSYLNGRIVFISNDGFLRDASEMHGRRFRKEIMNKAEDVLFSYFESNTPSEINFYIDEPISQSGQLAYRLQSRINDLKIKGEATTIKSPDFVLKNTKHGIISTADSVIIDHTKQAIADLPQRVLKTQFSPDFLDLTKIL